MVSGIKANKMNLSRRSLVLFNIKAREMTLVTEINGSEVRLPINIKERLVSCQLLLVSGEVKRSRIHSWHGSMVTRRSCSPWDPPLFSFRYWSLSKGIGIRAKRCYFSSWCHFICCQHIPVSSKGVTPGKEIDQSQGDKGSLGKLRREKGQQGPGREPRDGRDKAGRASRRGKGWRNFSQWIKTSLASCLYFASRDWLGVQCKILYLKSCIDWMLLHPLLGPSEQAAHIHGREMVPSAPGWIRRELRRGGKGGGPVRESGEQFGLVAARASQTLGGCEQEVRTYHGGR
ncbi:hypothetical protein H6P81_003311 [Aristolochia fimbriata]|uniref:Uncharacterized protein n=1 Tax=Aristolochia fimbriata TaxID=158543 RepID=A0AAV7FCZ5_ARIFI|nr:hypothetical protein H6P81_003311 [Aristolochia fimbriata]